MSENSSRARRKLHALISGMSQRVGDTGGHSQGCLVEPGRQTVLAHFKSIISLHLTVIG